ncbi:opacity protein-like surface antigen [Rhizomicrobium palustre]|uniref:Opacity protein-like surface antigen n=1 Tax=Rhizomicrobium palustre TaxID=189966 RepID=A0A846N1V2_9PROT|nr:outer membrane beta-barrel protein [Rhizomicrobium palustre]NIK89954.1 opacity protein-like surface antigen [Rhizomicrobium palustre]
MKPWAYAAAAALLSLTPALAQGYVQGTAGGTLGSWLDISGVGYKLNTGYNIGISGGLRLTGLLGPEWDLRGDIVHSQNQYACCSSHLGGTSFMANLIYHFDDLDLPVKPYVGVGAGAVAVNFGAMGGPHETQTRFGMQALAGVEYPLAGRLSLIGEYRYIAANNADFAGVGRVEYKTHNFMLGLKLSM